MSKQEPPENVELVVETDEGQHYKAFWSSSDKCFYSRKPASGRVVISAKKWTK
ncbi:MAG: hypothetical protein AB7G87_10015 [Clostridia bacterium]